MTMLDCLLAQYQENVPTSHGSLVGLLPIALLLVGLYLFFRCPPLIGTAPHNTLRFWLAVALVAGVSVANAFDMRSHDFKKLELFSGLVATFFVSVILWFLVRFAPRKPKV